MANNSGGKFVGPPPPSKPPRGAVPARPDIPAASTPLSGSEEVVIRTMRDDVEEKPASIPITRSASPPARSFLKTPSLHKKISPASPIPSAPSLQLPLPPKSVPESQKVILPPPGKPPRSRLPFFLIGGVVLVAVITVGIFFILRNNSVPSETELETGTVADAPHILPASAKVVLRYHFATPQDRIAVQSAWNTSPPVSPEENATVSFTPLLSGNPTLLLNDPDLSEVYYVLIPESTRPYLVVPATPSTKTLLEKTDAIQVAEVQGWLVVHQFDAQAYASALSTKTLAAAFEEGGSSSRQQLLFSQQTDAPLHVYLNPSAVSELRAQTLLPSLSEGNVQTLTLLLQFPAESKRLQISGIAEGQTPVLDSAASTDHQLLAATPADARLVRLGANFSEDFTRWRTTTQKVSDEILNRPNVAALINQLTAAYALYVRKGADGLDDLGLVITLPSAVQSSLAVGDASIEEALPALVPLFVASSNQSAPLAFSDGRYQEIPLRFVNISPNLALDYALFDGKLVVATSKEGMLQLLDTLRDKAPATLTSPAWQPLLNAWGALPATRDLVVAAFPPSFPLSQLLPVSFQNQPLLAGLSFQPADGQFTLQGIVISLIPTLLASPSPTPTASPSRTSSSPLPSPTLPSPT